MGSVNKEFIIEAMRRMSNWLAEHKLVNGAYSVPVTGGSPLGESVHVLIGNVGLWVFTREQVFSQRALEDADFLVKNRQLGSSDLELALWAVYHYLGSELTPEQKETYKTAALEVAESKIAAGDASTNFQTVGHTALAWAISYYFKREEKIAQRVNQKIDSFYNPSFGYLQPDGSVWYWCREIAEKNDDLARCDLDYGYDVWIKNYLHRAWFVLKLCGKDIGMEQKQKMNHGDTVVESYWVPGWLNNFRTTKRHRWFHTGHIFQLAKLLMQSAYNHQNPYRAWMSLDTIRCLKAIQKQDGSLPGKQFDSLATQVYLSTDMAATATSLARLAEILLFWYEPQIKPEPRFYPLSGTCVARGENYYIQSTGPGAIVDEGIDGYTRLYEAMGTLIKGGNYAWYSPKTERMMTDSPIETGQTTLVCIDNIVYGTMSDCEASQQLLDGSDSSLNGKRVRYIAHPTTPDGKRRAPLRVESTYAFFSDYVLLERKLSALEDFRADFVMDKHAFRLPFDTTIWYDDGQGENKVVIEPLSKLRRPLKRYSLRRPVDVATLKQPRWIYIEQQGFGMIIRQMGALQLRIYDCNDWGNMTGLQLGYLIFDYPLEWKAGEERLIKVILTNAQTIEQFKKWVEQQPKQAKRE